jgi:hypothetical protein
MYLLSKLETSRAGLEHAQYFPKRERCLCRDHSIVREATRGRIGIQARLETAWKVSLLRVLETDRVGHENAQ